MDELSFIILGVIKDVDRLKALYELFAETLEELTRMRSAYEGTPVAYSQLAGARIAIGPPIGTAHATRVDTEQP